MTKEEAIKSFEIENGVKKLIASLNKNHPSYKDYLENIERNEMAISALKGEWIPITEGMELPEHEVICCNNDGDIALGYLYFDEEENQIACDHDPYVMFGVVAYMESPEPYKKGE